jgi:hypothetical protein
MILMASLPMTSRDGFLGGLDPVRWFFLAFDADFCPMSKCSLFIPQTSYPFSSTKPAYAVWGSDCGRNGSHVAPGQVARPSDRSCRVLPPFLLDRGFLDPRRVPPQNARGSRASVRRGFVAPDPGKTLSDLIYR